MRNLGKSCCVELSKDFEKPVGQAAGSGTMSRKQRLQYPRGLGLLIMYGVELKACSTLSISSFYQGQDIAYIGIMSLRYVYLVQVR